jgi:acyl-CoA synthetase (AMP-forming)/AMP-acid ligase II
MALLDDVLARMGESFPDKPAYSVVDGDTMTFAEWDTRANQLAHGLVARGIQPDDRVAVHLGLENALRWMVAYTAVHRAGGVAVPVSPRLNRAEVARMLEHCSARGSIADGDLLAGDVQLDLAVVVDATMAGRTDVGAEVRGVVGWDEALEPDGSAPDIPRSADDLADILYTSGTTGHPKGVAVRHVNASMVTPGPPNWNGGAWLHASPMCTFAGLAFVYNPMTFGLRGIYMARFDAGRWLEVAEAEKPVAVFLVPAMTHLLLDHPRFETADLSSIQICSVGSAPLAPFVIERLQEKMPAAMVSNNYGMTEAGSVYCLTPQGEAVKRPGSVGQPVPPAEVRIVDGEEHEVAIGEVGEVRLRIPGRPREYFGDPEATSSTWVNGWLVTGDLGRVDADGYLYIVGRSKDVVIRGGNNVHAADVEHVIVSHPSVQEAAVIGVPHPVLGEDVVAYVVMRPGEELDGEELRAYCLDELADYKVPREWHFVGELPRNATGKVIKPELRRRHEEQAAAS